MPTKLIEVALPLDAINKEAAREKSIRHGHPSTLHLWWARRPLAACRAVLFAQLVDDPSAHPELFPTEATQDAERQRLFGIIERFVPWEASNDNLVLEEARTEIRKCYPDGPPPIVDPFCGGGSIPLEAQRLGLEARASDLNPVAILITKALIEFPAMFAGHPPVHREDNGTLAGTNVWTGTGGIAEDIRRYGRWLRDEAEKQLGHLYPMAILPDGKQATVVAWLWARTVTCPNPACRATMPLAHSFWLGKKRGKETWLNPIPDRKNNRIRFEIGYGKGGPPVDGTKTGRGANFRCLLCGGPADDDYVHDEIDSGRSGVQLMATVAEGVRQRLYLPAQKEQEYAATIPRPMDFPDEPARGTFGGNAQGRRYGFKVFADYFSNRQLATLTTFANLLDPLAHRVTRDALDAGFSPNDAEQYGKVIAAYLACAISRAADFGSTLTLWSSDPKMEALVHTFGRQALAMTWDFAEGNPFSRSSGNFLDSVGFVAAAVRRVEATVQGFADQKDATRELSMDGAILTTDPPYYDNIGYADLADYFYVWLRRGLGSLFPDLFSTMLTPKASELIASPYRFEGSRTEATAFFRDGFVRTFALARDGHASDTPLTLFYAFKQAELEGDDGLASTGWETLLSGLLDSGLMVTATWPMRTERSTRMVSIGTNALASSIVLACRPRSSDAGVTDRRGFQQALKARLTHDLRVLQSGGVAPVDLAQAAIGPGMAVFSRYVKVVESDGMPMRVRTALGLINQVLDEATAEQEGEFDEDTRFAIAWYAEYGVDDGPYGRADDLSRAKNVSVEGLVRAGILKSGGGKVRLLDRSELDAAWDPATDTRLTVWEVTQHLIRRLMDDGEASAAELLSRVSGLGDAARDLTYRLFQIAESKKWAKEASPYNALAAAWPELSRLAAAGPLGQGSLQV
jgi:putative DNA methylase